MMLDQCWGYEVYDRCDGYATAVRWGIGFGSLEE